MCASLTRTVAGRCAVSCHFHSTLTSDLTQILPVSQDGLEYEILVGNANFLTRVNQNDSHSNCVKRTSFFVKTFENDRFSTPDVIL